MGWERPTRFGGEPTEHRWSTPSWFGEQKAEHEHTRAGCTVFDQTSFSKFLVQVLPPCPGHLPAAASTVQLRPAQTPPPASHRRSDAQGPEALGAMQQLCANDVGTAAGALTYTGILNQKGGYESDVTVSRCLQAHYPTLLLHGRARGVLVCDSARLLLPCNNTGHAALGARVHGGLRHRPDHTGPLLHEPVTHTHNNNNKKNLHQSTHTLVAAGARVV